MLDFADWKILKEINIVSKTNYDQEIVIGQILYQRDISEEYYLKDDDEKDRFLKLLLYPKQELFPHDTLDEIILKTVQDKFPKSFVKNSEIAFSSDLEKVKILQSRPFAIAHIEIRPNFAQVDLASLVGKTFNFFKKDIKIYQEFTSESIKGHYFRGMCDYINHLQTFELLTSINFL